MEEEREEEQLDVGNRRAGLLDGKWLLSTRYETDGLRWTSAPPPLFFSSSVDAMSKK